jgi:predicted RNA-binding Zn-ribbon protein involved in translation (DUF1610 family)
MKLHTAMPMQYAHERYLGRPSCPRCGEFCVVPEISQYESAGQISHVWECDLCGGEFRTIVKLGELAH